MGLWETSGSMESGGFKYVKMWSVSEINDLDAWSVLDSPSDEERLGRTLGLFDDSLRQQPGAEVLENGEAKLTSWCWIAIAEKLGLDVLKESLAGG
jgi:hypothetical protein